VRLQQTAEYEKKYMFPLLKQRFSLLKNSWTRRKLAINPFRQSTLN